MQLTLAEFEGISYHVLLSEQDVAEASVDLIVISNMAIVEAIEDIKLFLKPGGRLCLLIEAQNVGSVEVLLRNACFTDLIKMDDSTDVQPTLVLASAPEAFHTNGTSHHPHIVLLQAPNASKAVQATATQLTASLITLGYNTTTTIWGSASFNTVPYEKCIFLSLLELEHPLLEHMEESDFEALKNLILNADSVFWVVGIDGPAGAMINGLCRVVRSEVPGINLRTLNAPSSFLRSPASTARLSELLARVFLSKSPDNEFRIDDDVVQVSRIIEDKALNIRMGHQYPLNSEMVDDTALKEVAGPLKLAVGQVGLMDSLYFEPDRRPLTELKSDEIEIQVKATALK